VYISADNDIFYTNPRCPFAHRAWICLLEKGIKCKIKRIPLTAEIATIDKHQLKPEDSPRLALSYCDHFGEGVTVKELKEAKKDFLKIAQTVPAFTDSSGE